MLNTYYQRRVCLLKNLTGSWCNEPIMMQWTHLKPMKLVRYLASAFVYKTKGQMGGDTLGYSWKAKFGWWWCRMGGSSDKVTPGIFFSCQCCVQEWGYRKREWSFCQPRYLTLTSCSQQNLSITFPMLGIISWWICIMAKPSHLSGLQP